MEEPVPQEDPEAEAQAETKNQGDGQDFVGTLVTVRRLPQPAPALALPRPGSGDLLARVAKVNSVARQQSLERLATWFPGYDFEAAAQTSDDRRFSVLTLGEALVDHLHAADTVDRIVSAHDLQVGRLMFSHGDTERRGQRPPRVTLDRPNVPLNRQSVERVAAGPVVAALRDRWTTIINNADNLDPVLSGVCEDLERAYGCLVNTNVYISWGDAKGFGPHWDMHDTIIVPASGTKTWRVFEPAVLSPLRPWIGADVSPRPVWEGDISVGDALVIPRGWGHEVLGSDDLAVHYTIGVNRFLAHQLLQRLEHEAGHWPIMRADLPYDPREPVISYDKSLHDNETDLAEFVAELATPDAVDRAIATYRARMRLRLFASLQETWQAVGADDWAGLGVRMPVPAGLMAVSADAESSTFAFGDRLVNVSAPVLDAFLALAETSIKPIDELPETTIEGGAQTLAVELIEAGIAHVAPLDG